MTQPETDESLFEQMMLDAVDPLTVRLGGLDWLVDVPAPDAIAALDDCAAADEVLDELLGEHADPVLDLLDGLSWSVTVDLADEVREHFALIRPPRDGWAALVDRIDRYGHAIEADLPAVWPGIELSQWFSGRRAWPQLWRLLRQLPTGSRYSAAVLSDKDLAQAQLDREAEQDDDEDDEPDPGPPLVGETYDRQLLRAAVSTLARIEHAVYAVNAPKGRAGKPPQPLERPRTARDELMRDSGLDEVYAIFAAIDTEWRHPDDVGREDRLAPEVGDGGDPLALGFHPDPSTGLYLPDG